MPFVLHVVEKEPDKLVPEHHGGEALVARQDNVEDFAVADHPYVADAKGIEVNGLIGILRRKHSGSILRLFHGVNSSLRRIYRIRQLTAVPTQLSAADL